MKTLYKRHCAIIIALCLLVLLITNTFASQETNPVTSIKYDVTTITYDNKVLEIPVLLQLTQPASDEGVYTSSETIFVPEMTEEALLKNKQIVAEIKAIGAPIATLGMGDSFDFHVSGYVSYYSTLNYFKTSDPNDLVTPMFTILSFKLEREVYTWSGVYKIGIPSARLMQIGYPGSPGQLDVLGQAVDYDTIDFNTLYSAPSDWKPVSKLDGYNSIGVKYWIVHIFADGRTANIETIHEAR